MDNWSSLHWDFVLVKIPICLQRTPERAYEKDAVVVRGRLRGDGCRHQVILVKSRTENKTPNHDKNRDKSSNPYISS